MSNSSPAAAPPFPRIRETEFPFTRDAIYLNAASVGPLPERARRAVDAHNARRGRVHELTDADFSAPLRRSRELAARLVGADAEEIALGGNTSFGINLAARALPVEPGQCIVVSDREFPANVYPWMSRSDARLELVPADAHGRPDEDRIRERLDRGDVAVFALSSVQFATGYRADVEGLGRFCRERGIYFVVDAIQSLGQVPMDVRAANIDVLATGGHKWLCSPFGTGFAYVRRELHSVLEPRAIGWSSMRASEDLSSLLDYRWELHPDARRYEVATPPFQDFAGLAESLGLILEADVGRIREHLLALTGPVVRWLESHPEVETISDLSPARRSAILCFRPPSPEATFARLQSAGIHCSLREGSIRLAPHFYNDVDDMTRVLEVLNEGGV